MANFKLYFTNGKPDSLVQLDGENSSEAGADCWIQELGLSKEAMRAAALLGKVISRQLDKWDLIEEEFRRGSL
jgi:hypothetical protein